MRIKLDENLPLQTASLLKALGHDVHTTLEEGLSGCVDREIWEAAQREERYLITQDLDFSDARRFVPGEHHGILLIRLHSPSRLSESDPKRFKPSHQHGARIGQKGRWQI